MPVRDKKSSFCSPLQTEQLEKGVGEQEVLEPGGRGAVVSLPLESTPVEELSARFGSSMAIRRWQVMACDTQEAEQ